MAEEFPIVVIGAGPVGVAAAAEVAERDLPVMVLEKGPSAGAAVHEWGHVRLFSMWRDLVDPAAEKLLTNTGWIRPADESYPTGAEWAHSYLEPLAGVLGDRVRIGRHVSDCAHAVSTIEYMTADYFAGDPRTNRERMLAGSTRGAPLILTLCTSKRALTGAQRQDRRE